MTTTAVPKIRLDKWLWYARVVKTRSLASKAVQAGHIRVNRNKVTSSSHGLKKDDVLTIALHQSVRILKVAALGVRRGPASEAALLYEDLTPASEKSSSDKGLNKAPSPERRPDKRERRQIEAFKSEFR